MIDAQTIQIIGTLGFPIYAVVWWQNTGSQLIQKNTDAINALCVQIAGCPNRKGK